MMNWLVCGTRKKMNGYEELVKKELNNLCLFAKPQSIIEGCCPDSADVYAERWAEGKGIEIQHFPANPGNYLKRNMEMVNKCDLVVAFWDNFSYGTCHTIACAVMNKIKVIVVRI